MPLIDAAVQDWRYAWRSLRRSPAFTAVVVFTLALGIGANTAIFTVVHHLLLAPLPYPDGNRIVRLDVALAANPDVLLGVNRKVFHTWKERSRTLEDFASVSESMYQLGVERDSVRGATVTPGFATLLRVQPALGRDFTADDVRAGAGPVMILGYGLWQARYGGARVADGDEPELWLPMRDDSVSGVVFARLGHGVTTETASREFASIMREASNAGGITRAFSDTTLRAHVLRARDEIDPNTTHAIEILLVATGGLLLIACANIANLLLMRAWTRQRELVIRRALGASRVRIARQALAESVMLGAAGGALGLVVAWRGLRAIIALRPAALGDLGDVHVDPAVLLWTTAMALASGVLFGIAPALLSGAQLDGRCTARRRAQRDG